MLRLRPYKNCDAKEIIKWCKDEETFRMWSWDRFGSFPITEADINQKYNECNGDCVEDDNFYPITVFDECGVVGHMVMRFINGDKNIIRFGFIIVDDAIRGKGYGKQMLKLALKYAFELLMAEKVTLGVFHNNMPAYYCYKSVGFKDVQMEKKETYNVCGETWSVLELEMEKEDYLNVKA